MRAMVGLLCAAMLAGCVTPTTPNGNKPPPGATALSQSFDGSTSLPPGWAPVSGNWSVVPNATARSAPNVLLGVGAARSTLKANVSVRDFEANLSFLMVAGDEGVGLSIRYEPNGDYRYLRFSPREDGWHYFVVKGGTADKKNEATAQNGTRPAFGEWVNFRVVALGRNVQAWDGNVLVLDFTETDDPAAGAVGPFLRGTNTALFDDFAVRPIP